MLPARARFGNPFGGGAQSGIGAVQRLLALIKQFLGRQSRFSTRPAVRSSSCAAKVCWVRCCSRFALASSIARCACLTWACDLLSVLLKIPGVHAGDHLPRADHVADVGAQFRDPARKFRVDIDLVGLQPAVAIAYAGGQLRLRVLPPIEPGASRDQNNGDKPDREPQPPPVPGSCKRYRRHGHGRVFIPDRRIFAYLGFFSRLLIDTVNRLPHSLSPSDFAGPMLFGIARAGRF